MADMTGERLASQLWGTVSDWEKLRWTRVLQFAKGAILMLCGPSAMTWRKAKGASQAMKCSSLLSISTTQMGVI